MGGVGVGLNFLREKDCEKIHEASLEVLHDRGAYFDSETAREVLRDHGCWEDADGCTHFPRTLVESALERGPRRVRPIAAGRPTTISTWRRIRCMPQTSARHLHP